jgi:hypothetical protein
MFSPIYYNKMSTFIRDHFGTSKGKKMDNIRNYFIELYNEIKPGLNQETKKVFRENVDGLFEHFKEHLPPNTPDQTIADRISQLLKDFDIMVKRGTILQRKRRAKK